MCECVLTLVAQRLSGQRTHEMHREITNVVHTEFTISTVICCKTCNSLQVTQGSVNPQDLQSSVDHVHAGGAGCTSQLFMLIIII